MEIKPAVFGDNLNEWFRVLGRTWRPLLITSLIAYIPLGVLFGAGVALTGAAQTFLDLTGDPTLLEDGDWARYVDDFLPLIWLGVAWIALQLIATIFVYLAAARTVALDRAGLGTEWRPIASHARGRMPAAVLAGILVGVASMLVVTIVVVIGWWLIGSMGANFMTVFLVAVVALTVFVVVVWLSLSVAFYPQVLSMEDSGGADSLRRSFEIVQGRWWPTLGFLLVTSLIASAVSQVASIALAPLVLIGAIAPAVLSIVYGLATILQGPFVAVVGGAIAIWYIDLRSRRESLTAEQLV